MYVAIPGVGGAVRRIGTSYVVGRLVHSMWVCGSYTIFGWLDPRVFEDLPFVAVFDLTVLHPQAFEIRPFAPTGVGDLSVFRCVRFEITGV